MPEVNLTLVLGYLLSNQNLHVLINRATPEMFSDYKRNVIVFKTYNHRSSVDEWVHFIFDHQLTSRQTLFSINGKKNYVLV
jgi:hypothetical protein